MKRQKSGKIINIASGTFFSGSGNMPHYTTAKGGVVALTRVMARQLGEFGINVNCMTPGSTMSEESVSDEVRKRREQNVLDFCARARTNTSHEHEKRKLRASHPARK